jgi:hypothetical protein
MRRQILEDQPREWVEGDFRKKRTYSAAKTLNHQTIMRAAAYKPKSGSNLDETQLNWIGKKIIYMNQGLDPVEDLRYPGWMNKNTVPEYVIAKYAQPVSYRIIYVDSDIEGLMMYDDPVGRNALKARSVLTTDFRPGRMNILVDLNDIIRDVRYF